ncbi:hypothetical protein WIS52_27040 [Pseudonocardia nematodicida]|uniref:Uncharacterized protein n=1 Tax=Pseudonocardia nematodicida TaxID=1206997 RepID=A0ABV1KIF5_9PSEU
MSTSWILFLSAAGCGLLFAGCGLWAQLVDGTRSGPYRPREAFLPVGILAFCLAFGGLAFLIDSGVAETTLYETVEDTAAVSDDPPVTGVHRFGVQHPGARHDLLVAPESSISVDDPVRVRVRLSTPDGLVAVDEERTLDVRCEGLTGPCEWDTFTADFVPASAGDGELRVTVLDPGVTRVHVRIGDEEKTDGERAPGY